MPPEITPIPLPDGRGRESVPFLEANGLVARIPPIRSSDYELALADPFRYYLTRRLGIVPAHSWSAALSRGSWLHRFFEYDPFTDAGASINFSVQKLLEKRLAELQEINNALGIVGDSNRDLLAREKLDVETSLGWYMAARTVKINDKYGTFPQFLSQPYWRILDRELPISHVPLNRSSHTPPLNGILDLLLYNERQNNLWILDLKSCAEPCINRLATCPLEFQTQHYLHILSNLVLSKTWREKYALPDNVTIAGMMHLAIQKPDIKFCQVDRSYRMVPFTPSSGKNKGITREEKEFFGEPVLANYIKRCAQWYTGKGEYLHLEAEREVAPTVNISISPMAKVLDTDGYFEYNSRLTYVEGLATCEAFPARFITSASALRAFGKLSKYAPFAMTLPRLWPEIMEREGFIVAHREEEIPDGPQEETAQA